MIELQLLGGLDIAGAGISPQVRARRHAMALLALAASASPQAISRDRLMAYLWPESETEKASNSLRQTIFLIKKNLGDDVFLPENGTGLQLDPSKITVDLWEFRSALSRGNHADAVALYRGAFLDSFQVPGAPDFGRWVETEAEKIRRQFLNALDALASAATDEERFDDAVAWRRRQAATEPFSSRVALALLNSLADAGDRTGALEYATVYESLVRSHLEIAPDPAVSEFVTELRNNPSIAKRKPGRKIAAASRAVVPTSHTDIAAVEPIRTAGAPGFTQRKYGSFALAAAVILVLGVVAVRAMIPSRDAAAAARDGVIIVASGMTSEGGRDTASQIISCEGPACSGGPYPQPAFIVPAHPSYAKPATGTTYVLPVPDGTTRVSPGYKCCTTAIFENKFAVPPNASSATITVTLLADNWAGVSVNGIPFGAQKDSSAQDNFINPSTFTHTFLPDRTGVNKLQVKFWDGGAALGLNYRAFVTYVPADEEKK